MQEPPLDPRKSVYEELHKGRLTEDKERSIYSARYILNRVQEFFPVKSVLDIGCGIGTYLAAAQEMGMEIAGVEGPWLGLDGLDIDKSFITITDLEKPIDLDRKFDLAISLEVGEHLSDAASPHLVKALVSHADYVVFSAAIPLQGGMHHINEQFLSYWVQKFNDAGFLPIDLLRGPVWQDTNVHVWLRQNMILFAKAELVRANEKLNAESLINRPLDIVNPQVFLDKVLEARGQLANMQQTLLQHGMASLRETPQGTIFELRRPHGSS
ncbi:MAG TPA: methyltransferase domain-containing protein [Fimbriimonadaceae bacterium]|jgi:SAM-dependent methyltransferase